MPYIVGVGGEVGMIYPMCLKVGGGVWVHGDAAILYYVYVNMAIILCV